MFKKIQKSIEKWENKWFVCFQIINGSLCFFNIVNNFERNMIYRCWRWSTKSSEKSCLILVMDTWVIWIKWKSNVEQGLHFMRNPFWYDSSQAYTMIQLMGVVIRVMKKPWFDPIKTWADMSFMIRLKCNLWFESQSYMIQIMLNLWFNSQTYITSCFPSFWFNSTDGDCCNTLKTHA